MKGPAYQEILSSFQTRFSDLNSNSDYDAFKKDVRGSKLKPQDKAHFLSEVSYRENDSLPAPRVASPVRERNPPESSTPKYDENDFLYRNGKIDVVYNSDRESHILLIDRVPTPLDKGVLERLANTPLTERDDDSHGLASRLHALDPHFLTNMVRTRLSYEDVSWALVQARIKELEETVESA